MKVCIVGAGAVGGLIGTRLAANTPAEVSALARGDTLESLNGHGWRLRQGSDLLIGPARASSSPRELGPQDLVIIAVKTTGTFVATLKGPSLTTLAPQASASG